PDKKIDVLIVGRGGGSQEDLWSFNDEDLARAIRASEIPVISAVGHEIDHTISDLVADVRAATPSNAAEMVASSESEIRKSIGASQRIMIASIETRLIGFRSRYVRAASSPALARFPDLVARLKEGIFTSVGSMKTSLAALLLKSERRFEASKHSLSADRLRLGIANRRKEVSAFDSAQRTLAAGIVGAKQEQLGVAVAALEALSPLKVLSRGYSITQNAAGVVVKKARDVSSGDNISIKVSDGRIDATVNGVTEVQK
ncbi:MAG: exodeoxyribonuclease VII large subunit, partial [Acidobacteriota bacterium]